MAPKTRVKKIASPEPSAPARESQEPRPGSRAAILRDLTPEYKEGDEYKPFRAFTSAHRANLNSLLALKTEAHSAKKIKELGVAVNSVEAKHDTELDNQMTMLLAHEAQLESLRADLDAQTGDSVNQNNRILENKYNISEIVKIVVSIREASKTKEETLAAQAAELKSMSSAIVQLQADNQLFRSKLFPIDVSDSVESDADPSMPKPMVLSHNPATAKRQHSDEELGVSKRAKVLDSAGQGEANMTEP